MVPDRRFAIRRPVALSGHLSIAGVSSPVVVRNLSTTGALVTGSSGVVPGDRVQLSFVLLAISDQVEAQATVRWVHGAAIGVEFDPLPPRAQAALDRFLQVRMVRLASSG